MFDGVKQSGAVHFTKRELGEGYLVGVAITLAGVLGGLLVVNSHQIGAWVGLGLVPVGGLIMLTYWMRSLTFDRTQVWRIALYGALGTSLSTGLIFSGNLVSGFLTVSTTLTVVLTIGIAASTVGGALIGIALESHRATQQLSVRNTVLHRVLRHNLRNDLTVVLTHIEDVKTSIDGPEREKLATTERKIHHLVDLVDNIRQVNISIQPRDGPPPPIELVTLIEDHIADLNQTNPEIELTTELPDEAWAHAEEQFGLVIDNVVESATMYSTERASLHVEVTVDGGNVRLCIDDMGETMPESDLRVLAEGTEEILSHGHGVELWLVSWLTERSDGTLRIDRDGPNRCISITIARARPQSSDISDRRLPT